MNYPVCLAEHELHAFPWHMDRWVSFDSLFTGITVLQVVEDLSCPLARLGAEKINRHRAALVQLGVRLAVITLDGIGASEFKGGWGGELFLNRSASLVTPPAANAAPRYTFSAGSTYIIDSRCRVLFAHKQDYKTDFPDTENILHLCSSWVRHGIPSSVPQVTEELPRSRATQILLTIRPRLQKVRSLLRIST